MKAFDILSTTPFRRLAGKQQVFGLVGDDHSRTRYSHCIETAEIAKRLFFLLPHPQQIALSAKFGGVDALQAACLLHDIGMPPFGHKGEYHIREWVTHSAARLHEFGAIQLREYAAFDSNAQGLRLIYYHPQFRALHDTTAASIIGGAIKYPWTRAAKNQSKCGIFDSEFESYRKTARKAGGQEIKTGVFARHPLSWLVEIADDIAYLSADIEDAARLGVILEEEFDSIFAPIAPLARQPESLGHQLWLFRRALVDRLTGHFLQCAQSAQTPEALGTIRDNFFGAELVTKLKTASYAYIYARRDVRDKTSEAVMAFLLRDIFAELAEEASLHAPIKRVVARFREKRSSLVAHSSPLQLTVDLVSEFTDKFSVELYSNCI
jgi:predicted deoxyguanosinetriphosphate triphosphohydrolase